MRNIEKILASLGLVALLATGACSASTNNDADGTAGDAGTTDTATVDTATVDTSTADVPVVGKQIFESIVIWDHSGEKLDCTKNSIGTDLDAVALYRGKPAQLMGVGKIGSAKFSQGSTPLCPVNDGIKKKQTDLPVGPLNGHVYKSKDDTGYISLNGGSIELQIGACSNTSAKGVEDCDGNGAVVIIEAGDELDVYEVDTTYKAGGSGPQKGFAEDICVCYADEYQVDLRPKVGADAGTVTFPAPGKGDSTDGKWFAGTHADAKTIKLTPP